MHAVKQSEGQIQELKSEFGAFEDSVQRIRHKIMDPYEQIQSCIDQIEEIQEVTELLQLISRLLFLNKRLSSVLSSDTRDSAEAAQIIGDMGTLPLYKTEKRLIFS